MHEFRQLAEHQQHQPNNNNDDKHNIISVIFLAFSFLCSFCFLQLFSHLYAKKKLKMFKYLKLMRIAQMPFHFVRLHHKIKKFHSDFTDWIWTVKFSIASAFWWDKWELLNSSHDWFVFELFQKLIRLYHEALSMFISTNKLREIIIVVIFNNL